LKISAKYTDEDYKKLKFDSESDWYKALEIFKDRINERFLRPISKIQGLPYAGFSIMALDCLLIETLQQFRKGVPRTEYNMGKEYFIEFLTKTSFKEYFSQDMAGKFYDQVRNGILHQAETKSNTLIKIGDYPIACPTEDSNGLIINRNKFHERLIEELNQYLDELSNNENSLLRKNFRKKMDYICRKDQNKHQNNNDNFLYFAYGSNMSEERLKEREIGFEKYNIGYIENMKLIMNKKSIDGSAKANIVKTNGETVWGVLYRIDSRFKQSLDRFEGNYQSEILDVNLCESCSVKALTYTSNYTTEDQRAYDDYKEIIIQGALEHNLPEYYVELLKKIPTKSIWGN